MRVGAFAHAKYSVESFPITIHNFLGTFMYIFDKAGVNDKLSM